MKPVLISHYLCPYVQRIAISLAEKQLPFERVYVDLANKPDWFRKLSPLGKVPLLQVTSPQGEETAIFESSVILEFLEETNPCALHPADPYARARHRGWIEFGSAALNGVGRLYSAKTSEAFDGEARALSEMFDRLEAELRNNHSGGGKWFSGDSFSLVDAVFAPVFRYFDIFDKIADFGTLKDKPLVANWRNALAGRQSVIDAVTADYPEKLVAFLKAKESHLSSTIHARSRQLSANQPA
jgi:glutathione S-transferase